LFDKKKSYSKHFPVWLVKILFLLGCAVESEIGGERVEWKLRAKTHLFPSFFFLLRMRRGTFGLSRRLLLLFFLWSILSQIDIMKHNSPFISTSFLSISFLLVGTEEHNVSKPDKTGLIDGSRVYDKKPVYILQKIGTRSSKNRFRAMH
jgi:hypothetical protein